MKIFLMAVVLTLTLHAELVSELRWNFNNLNEEERANIELAYNVCEAFDLQNTCAAIAWKESFGGRIMINERSGDYGLMQINLKYFMKGKKIKDTHYNRQVVKTKLVVDKLYNIQASIETLLYFRKIHKDNWRKIWGSYNGGYTPNFKYAKDIAMRVKLIKEFIRTKKLLVGDFIYGI